VQCGVVQVEDKKLKADISYAVAKAFDVTLPTNARMLIGDIK
jgi:hypothetical protein